jgi:hypothetical protein
VKTGAVAPDHSLTLVARNRAATVRERFPPGKPELSSRVVSARQRAMNSDENRSFGA